MRVLFLVTLIICGALGTAGGEGADNSNAVPENPPVFVAGVPGGQSLGLAEPNKDDALWTSNSVKASTTEPVRVEKSATTAMQPAEHKLKTVCGVSLYDSREDVVAKLGEPSVIQTDEFFADLEVYQYEGLRVAFMGEFIQYVDIELTHGLELDGIPVESTKEALVKALGEPDYKAEDGIVFQRDEALLKLFLDPETGKPYAISYYHIATV
ncbi:hypothetical protein ACX93W_20040 [Paenibacillus sp. CAU 1782]